MMKSGFNMFNKIEKHESALNYYYTWHESDL